MRIAILGWGSLIWDQRELKTKGTWRVDGPKLPIEFAKISDDGRLTLVIKPDFNIVQVQYIESAFETLEDARTDLQKREKIKEIEKIGFIDYVQSKSQIKRISKEIKAELDSWNESKKFDAIIWTDLGPNFSTKTKTKFTILNIKQYLNGLNSDQFKEAKKYIINTPDQIQTRFRKEISDFVNTKQ